MTPVSSSDTSQSCRAVSSTLAGAAGGYVETTVELYFTVNGVELRPAPGAADVSLQHLLGVRPDIVKIDTTVIHGIAEDELRQAVACAYASLAKRAGAVSLAEGIETEAELAMLLSLEVETGQGYLLGRPAFLED